MQIIFIRTKLKHDLNRDNITFIYVKKYLEYNV